MTGSFAPEYFLIFVQALKHADVVSQEYNESCLTPLSKFQTDQSLVRSIQTPLSKDVGRNKRYHPTLSHFCSTEDLFENELSGLFISLKIRECFSVDGRQIHGKFSECKKACMSGLVRGGDDGSLPAIDPKD